MNSILGHYIPSRRPRVLRHNRGRDWGGTYADFVVRALWPRLGVVRGRSCGPAPPGSFDVLLKNTIRITSSQGEEFVYFNADNTFMTRGPDGDTYGRWRIDGDKICTKVKDAAKSCGAIEPNRSVGDHWEHQLNGETDTLEIVQGR